MGGLGETVTKTEEFAAAFERVMAHDGPALIEIITDPQALTPVKTLDEFRNGQ